MLLYWGEYLNLNLSKVESYTETINTLRSLLNLDYYLDRKILDILPKLIEARARYWTKGDYRDFDTRLVSLSDIVSVIA